jgi:hypothetical protein
MQMACGNQVAGRSIIPNSQYLWSHERQLFYHFSKKSKLTCGNEIRIINRSVLDAEWTS